jgi:hypothetical protein
MNVTDFTYLLQHPEKVVDPLQTRQLEEVIQEYPYFQAARALHLKGLKNLNSFKYNNALKVAAAYTADRDVLFDFITSKAFMQNAIADSIAGKKVATIESEPQEKEEVIPVAKTDTTLIEAVEDGPLPRTTQDADTILDPSLFRSKDPEIDIEIAREKERAREALELGKPLPFTRREKHSFMEWLQLTSIKPIKQAAPPEKEVAEFTSDIEFPLEETSEKAKKFELIDKFLEENPKIVPQSEDTFKVAITQSAKIDSEELMTETLAKVYLEQKKYKKALQAYKILSLKYPEKSSFFASRIKAVKQLQKENS